MAFPGISELAAPALHGRPSEEFGRLTTLDPERRLTHRILIVDDDLHIREVIRVALKKAGMTVFEARDGKEALTRFAADRPDLIILDIGMPEFDGLDVCREIRKSSDVPILFLSARDDEIDRVLGLEIGGDDYVTKPFSPRELVARVNAILPAVNCDNVIETIHGVGFKLGRCERLA